MIFFVQVLIPNSKYRTFSTFLFSKQYIKHNMHSWVHAQSYLTLCNPMELKPARLLCPWDSWGKNTGVVAITFFRGSSRLRDWTWVSCIAGRVFTVWATRKAHLVAILKRVLESHLTHLANCGVSILRALSYLCYSKKKKKIGFQLLTDKSSFCTLPFPGRTRLNPAVAQRSSEVIALVADYVPLVFARRSPNFLFCSPIKQPAIKT